jgi:UDP-N-acetylmuramoyl-tripeptide--D-alanyl-D-alanine ligase
MEPRPLNFIAAACGGNLVSGDERLLVRRICTDSRQVQAGDLFIALPGDRFDGHDFLGEVLRKGAAALMVRHGRAPASPNSASIITVADTRKALGRLAASYRVDFRLPVVAVAGSNGKTTTKDLIASVLKQRFPTLFSEASFNNDIGVPMTLLRLEQTHQAAVLEAGTNHPGELAQLLEMIRPRFGVLTSIGREHLEFFGDLAGVAEEEGWIAESLPPDGKLFINGDNPWSERVAHRARTPVVRAGFGAGNDYRASGARLDHQGSAFAVQAPEAEFSGEYRINLLGRHQIQNALYAIALGAELGLRPAEIRRGLAECRPAKMRMQLWELNGVQILDDAYNANADSMAAALETFRDLPCKGRRIAVLGDMAELGAHCEAAHEEVGRRAAELGVVQLFAVGKMAPALARGARGAGLNRLFEFADVEAAAAALKSFVKAGDALLLKASRSSRFERITELLRKGETAPARINGAGGRQES